MLGIEMPQVGSGNLRDPAHLDRAERRPESQRHRVQESTAAALTVGTTTARRISARLSIGLEDVALVGQHTISRDRLRQNLRMSLGNEYDNQCLNGAGVAPAVNGLINQLTNPTDPTAIADFAAYLSAFSAQIDGLWARRLREVRILTGPA